jgi:hypothetical protein
MLICTIHADMGLAYSIQNLSRKLPH